MFLKNAKYILPLTLQLSTFKICRHYTKLSFSQPSIGVNQQVYFLQKKLSIQTCLTSLKWLYINSLYTIQSKKYYNINDFRKTCLISTLVTYIFYFLPYLQKQWQPLSLFTNFWNIMLHFISTRYLHL